MAFDALVDYSRKTLDSLLNRGRSDDTELGFADQGVSGQVYNEVTFRHFLGLERKRAARSGRSVLLLLVSVKDAEGREVSVSRTVAARLFSSIAECVREVDFVGWYRDRVVAGAVLAQGASAPAPGTEQAIVERVTQTLRQQLSARVADGLQVRLLHMRRGE